MAMYIAIDFTDPNNPRIFEDLSGLKYFKSKRAIALSIKEQAYEYSLDTKQFQTVKISPEFESILKYWTTFFLP